MNKKKLDILIPTYNRCEDLKKNLIQLNETFKSEDLSQFVNIIISDNHSADSTEDIASHFQKTNDWIYYFRQKRNIGLEKNAVFCLEVSSSDYVMFLGDDDFIPDDYLKYCIQKIFDDEDIYSVIPAFNSVYGDGKVIKRREEVFGEKLYPAGTNTMYKLSRYGHQLSGLVLKRKGLLNAYLKYEEQRNIYPFIFWLSFNLLRGKALYAPKFRVSVSQSNIKDWNYDDSGLLKEVFKNYELLHKLKRVNYIQRVNLELIFVLNDMWRLRVNEFSKNILAIYDLTRSKSPSLVTKVLLPFSLLVWMSRLPKKLVYKWGAAHQSQKNNSK